MEQASPFQAAIDELEKELADLERNANALLTTINLLRSRAGQPPRPAGFGGDRKVVGDEVAVPATIRHDTFFGKKLSTSAREFLEMRKAADLGPARVKEIFEALKQGGYQFDTKDDENAQASLRSLMSKYTVIFQKLPNGTWGLKNWYPDAKRSRAKTPSVDAPEADIEDDVIHAPDESANHAEAA